MNKAQLMAIVTDEAEHLADITIYEPLSHNGQVMESIKRLITGVMQGHDITPLDLGMNSQFVPNDGSLTIRFIDPDGGGNSKPMITIVPRTPYIHMVTQELGMAIAASFVRNEQPFVPTSAPSSRQHQHPRP